ncbi:urocanate hydratase [Arthrobacter sp. Hiyo4]|nr:urocanate hydratase [Arthrobacter sp. Hiyo4]
MRGHGRAQPLAVTLNEGACLIVDVDESHLRRRAGKRYLDEVETDLDTAIAKVLKAKEERRGWSVGYVGNAAEVFPEILRRHRAGELTVDIVTDQTSAHDPLSYLPEGITVAEWQAEAAADPEGFTKKAQASMAKHVQAMVEFQDAGAEVFDYGNSIRDEARKGGYTRAFEFPGFVPAYIRPLFCEGLGPFRWVALSGDPEDIAVTDAAIKELFPENKHLHRWIDAAQERVEFEGLPARICWLGYGDRAKAGLRLNQLVKEGKVKAPIVIGRDHLDSGSVASPTGRPRPWPTAPTPSRTGRCSTPCSTPPPAPPGSRSTTAAASGSAAPSTPARSPSQTAPTSPPRNSNASSPTTPAWASSATPTPATTAPPTSPKNAASASPCKKANRPIMTLTTHEPLTVTLGSSGVTPEDVVAVARHNARVTIAQEALDAVAKVRSHIDELAHSETPPTASPPASARWPTGTSPASCAPSCRNR